MEAAAATSSSSAPSLIPEAPPTPADLVTSLPVPGDAAPTAVDLLQALSAEPRLAELGLAGNTPVGLIQNLLEFFHMDLGLPWWGAIVVGKQRFLERFKFQSGCGVSLFPSCFPRRNRPGPVGRVSRHSEGSERSSEAQQRASRNHQTHQQNERGQAEWEQV